MSSLRRPTISSAELVAVTAADTVHSEQCLSAPKPFSFAVGPHAGSSGISAQIILRRLDGRMVFVPERQVILALNAWPPPFLKASAPANHGNVVRQGPSRRAEFLDGCQQDADGDPFGSVADILQRRKGGGQTQSTILGIAPIGPGSPGQDAEPSQPSGQVDDGTGYYLPRRPHSRNNRPPASSNERLRFRPSANPRC